MYAVYSLRYDYIFIYITLHCIYIYIYTYTYIFTYVCMYVEIDECWMYVYISNIHMIYNNNLTNKHKIQHKIL